VNHQNFDATYSVGIRTYGLQTRDSRPCRFTLVFEGEREDGEKEVEWRVRGGGGEEEELRQGEKGKEESMNEDERDMGRIEREGRRRMH
jgi:hypothetical protein